MYFFVACNHIPFNPCPGYRQVVGYLIFFFACLYTETATGTLVGVNGNPQRTAGLPTAALASAGLRKWKVLNGRETAMAPPRPFFIKSLREQLIPYPLGWDYVVCDTEHTLYQGYAPRDRCPQFHLANCQGKEALHGSASRVPDSCRWSMFLDRPDDSWQVHDSSRTVWRRVLMMLYSPRSPHDILCSMPVPCN